MLGLFLFHLLGGWLLLSQLPRETQGQEMEVFTKCNLELVRFFIHVCGTHTWADDMRKQRKTRSEQPAEIMPFSIAKNAENLNTKMEFIPTSQQELEKTLAESQPLLKEQLQQAASNDINLNFEEFKENSFHRQREAENKSLSELRNIRLVKHFLKKRQAPYLLSYKCCYEGCTKKEVAVFC
ncbi:PREDICTED: prorelaxin H2 [Miniopterus natalensis]|uniref:prorelaxin H2 n=1 Tax=Miniopterus natalensis TaxID=291302 RepID=UPI0007A71386|nr:PREDICTED: prorelaxin H2 [Miniopterus natalensis]